MINKNNICYKIPKKYLKLRNVDWVVFNKFNNNNSINMI